MKTPEQLKGALRNMAINKGIRADALLQIFLFERIIERLSKSRFTDNFVLKGGLLISAIIGVDRRTTMDMDKTVHGIPVNEEYMISVLNEILVVPIEDGVSFSLQSLKPIREKDVYENFCATITADYGRIHAILKIDITTGDAITPAEVIYEYPFLFDTMTVNVMAYPFSREYKLTLKNELSHTVSLGTDTFGNITRMDNILEGFETKMQACEEMLSNTKIQLGNAKIEVQRPFAQEEDLKSKSARLDELNILLNMDKRENELVDSEPEEEIEEVVTKNKDYER